MVDISPKCDFSTPADTELESNNKRCKLQVDRLNPIPAEELFYYFGFLALVLVRI